MIEAGATIGNYRVLKKIGTGGMGAVYLAEHPLIGKRVALKVIHRELAGNREVVSRFFQEARAVNQIGSEHIVEIHDFGQTPDGDHFYMMEYLEGQTLANVLSRERVFDVMRALHIGAQVASALGDAHGSGVIHRDLKPDNVMLVARAGDPDFVKLLDFGLAKMFAVHTVVKTAVGVLLGTPQYMSPEACESKPSVDHRTDIYGLGVLLFQMMTGVLPFDGESMGEILVKQVTALPPGPRGINPGIPASVEQILLRCLAKAPDARFPTMLALRDALLDPEAYLRGSPPIQSARSVAPGEARVDARTLVAYANQTQKSRALPLPAMPSLSGNDAKTLIAEPRATGQAAAAEPKLDTMRIATPHGYSSEAPRRVWPIVLVMGLLLGLGGGAFAVAWFGRGGGDRPIDAATARPVDARPATPNATPLAGGAGPIDAAPLATALAIDAAPAPASDAATSAQLVFDSVPEGAEVIGPDRVVLGKTPLKLTWPIGTVSVSFEIRHAGYKRKVETLAVGQNTSIHIELDKLADRPPPRHDPPPHPGSGGRDTGLMKPGDD